MSVESRLAEERVRLEGEALDQIDALESVLARGRRRRVRRRAGVAILGALTLAVSSLAAVKILQVPKAPTLSSPMPDPKDSYSEELRNVPLRIASPLPPGLGVEGTPRCSQRRRPSDGAVTAFPEGVVFVREPGIWKWSALSVDFTVNSATGRWSFTDIVGFTRVGARYHSFYLYEPNQGGVGPYARDAKGNVRMQQVTGDVTGCVVSVVASTSAPRPVRDTPSPTAISTAAQPDYQPPVSPPPKNSPAVGGTRTQVPPTIPPHG